MKTRLTRCSRIAVFLVWPLAAMAQQAPAIVPPADSGPAAAPVPDLPLPTLSAAETQRAQSDDATLQKLRHARMDLNFDQTRLEDAMDIYARAAGVDVNIAWDALRPSGVGKDDTLTLQLRQITGEQALQTLLLIASRHQDLDFTIDHGAVVVSTIGDLSAHTVRRLYDVRDLSRGQPNLDQAHRSLAYMIESTVQPDTWIDQGGNSGHLEESGGGIIVTNTLAAHLQIDDLLHQLRHPLLPQDCSARDFAGVPVPARITPSPNFSHTPVANPADALNAQADRDAARALQQVLPELVFPHKALGQMVGPFQDASGLNIAIDWHGLEAAGVDTKALFMIGWKNTLCDYALQDMVRAVGGGVTLDYQVRDGIVFISTPDRLESDTILRVYDVSDLTHSPQEIADLRKAVEATTSTDSWRDNGGTAGSLVVWNSEFVIVQTRPAQRCVANFLDQLRHPLPPG